MLKPEYSDNLGQYHCYWCPGCLCGQAIIRHGIEYAGWLSPWRPQRRLSTACTLKVLRNNRKCEYSLAFPKINSAPQHWPFPVTTIQFDLMQLLRVNFQCNQFGAQLLAMMPIYSHWGHKGTQPDRKICISHQYIKKVLKHIVMFQSKQQEMVLKED